MGDLIVGLWNVGDIDDEMWGILVVKCGHGIGWMWKILIVKCEIFHVVMEGKGYLQLGGKDICDLLEETLVVKFWKYWWWNLEVISGKVRYMILLCERYISDRVWHKCRGGINVEWRRYE